MTWLKALNQSTSIVWTTVLALGSSSIFFPSAHAHPLYEDNNTFFAANPIQSILKFLGWQSPAKKRQPKDRGAPAGRSRGGGTGGLCPAVDDELPPLTALIPSFTLNSAEQPFGVTNTGKPTFWFYVPYRAKARRHAEFVLIDEKEEDFYKTEVELTEIPGIISLSVPKELPVDKEYRWVFSMICDRSNRSGDITVNGWIQRVTFDTTLQSQLKQAANPQARIALYAKNGIWFDALTALAELHREKQNDEAVNENWRALIESANLSQNADELHQLSAAPMSPCCTIKTKTSGY